MVMKYGGNNMETTNQNSNWYPSAYGADDEIGAANLLTQEVVLQAILINGDIT